MAILRFKKAFVVLKPIFGSMTGRIVLSHVYVSTLRRTRSTEKLISTGLVAEELSRWNKLKIL